MKSKSIRFRFVVAACSAWSFVGIALAEGDFDHAHMGQKVLLRLSLEKLTDLEFGSAAQGDNAKSVSPLAQFDGRASFRISGQPFSSYQIVLNNNQESFMSLDDGTNPRNRIRVYNFRSYPEANNGGTLDSQGKAVLYVGATRDALRDDQTPGNYDGKFTVLVRY